MSFRSCLKFEAQGCLTKKEGRFSKLKKNSDMLSDSKNSSNRTSFMGNPVAKIKVPERVVSQFGVA